MKVDVKIGSRTRTVEIERGDGRPCFRLDGQDVHADILEVTPGMYSVLLGGEAFEARIEERGGILCVQIGGREYAAEIMDPRQWRRGGRGSTEAQGRQQVRAPMPGKVVHVMIEEGVAIRAGQGLLVVEAMKMQNEIKSPKSGRVEQLLVREGQAVSAGEVLAVIA